MNRLCNWMLLISSCISWHLCATQTVIEIVGAENPPYLIESSTGELNSGIFYNELTALFSRLDNTSFSIHEYPKKRAAYSLIHNKVSAIMFSQRSPLEQLYLEYVPVSFDLKYRIYTHKNKFPNGLNIQDNSELVRYTMGVVAGESYGDYLDELIANSQIFHQKVVKTEHNLLKLMKQRVDFIIMEDENAAYLIDKLGLEGKITMSRSPFLEKEIFLLAFSKYSPHKQLIPLLSPQVIAPLEGK